MTSLLSEAIVVEPKVSTDACVIWMHGLGADGYDFADVVPSLKLPHDHRIRFIFPHAPSIPVTINGGYVMPAWYDIQAIDIGALQDSKGIHRSAGQIEEMVKQLIAQGVQSQRIMLIGFSQGGAMALHTALRFGESLAGVAALSAYLPLHDQLKNEIDKANSQVPIFMAHGLEDNVVPYTLGLQSCEHLKSLGLKVDWHTYSMAHTVCLPELEALGHWIRQIL